MKTPALTTDTHVTTPLLSSLAVLRANPEKTTLDALKAEGNLEGWVIPDDAVYATLRPLSWAEWDAVGYKVEQDPASTTRHYCSVGVVSIRRGGKDISFQEFIETTDRENGRFLLVEMAGRIRALSSLGKVKS